MSICHPLLGLSELAEIKTPGSQSAKRQKVWQFKKEREKKLLSSKVGNNLQLYWYQDSFMNK